MKAVTIRHAYNLEHYQPRLWERFVLWFCRLETHEHDGIMLQYKHFGNRVYIFGIRKVAYLLNEPPNGGVNQPWMN
jgi:hypothetical protein